MGLGDAAAEIELHAIGEACERGILRDAVEGDVRDRRVVAEIKRAVLGEGGNADIDGLARMQIGEKAELARLGLPLVEPRGIERGNRHAIEKADSGEWRCRGIVRDLERAAELARDRGKAVLAVEDLVDIGESMVLQGLIVNLRERRRHAVDAMI